MKFFVIASLAATLFLGVASIPLDVYEREPNDLQYLSSRATTCVIASLKGAVCDVAACTAVGGGCILNANTSRCRFNKKMSDNRSAEAPSCRGCDCISGPDAKESNPGTSKPNPDTSKSNPGTSKPNPDTSKSNPDTSKSNPGSGGADKSHPQSPHTAKPTTKAKKA